MTAIRALAWRPWWGYDEDGAELPLGCPEHCAHDAETEYPIGGGHTVTGCPMALLSDPVLWVVAETWHDWERGQCHEWQDGLAAWVVLGVRLLHHERAACLEAIGERARRRTRSRGSR